MGEHPPQPSLHSAPSSPQGRSVLQVDLVGGQVEIENPVPAGAEVGVGV
jgi:hypothetical protein